MRVNAAAGVTNDALAVHYQLGRLAEATAKPASPVSMPQIIQGVF